MEPIKTIWGVIPATMEEPTFRDRFPTLQAIAADHRPMCEVFKESDTLSDSNHESEG